MRANADQVGADEFGLVIDSTGIDGEMGVEEFVAQGFVRLDQKLVETAAENFATRYDADSPTGSARSGRFPLPPPRVR